MKRAQKRFLKPTLEFFGSMRRTPPSYTPKKQHKVEHPNPTEFTDISDIDDKMDEEHSQLVAENDDTPANFTDISSTNILPDGTKRHRQPPVYFREARLAVS